MSNYMSLISSSLMGNNCFGLGGFGGFGCVGDMGMGGLNSIFYNCDGSTNYNGMLGYQLGNFGVNLVTQAIGSIASSRKADSKEVHLGNLNDIQAKINTKQAEVDDLTEEYEITITDVNNTTLGKAYTTAKDAYDKNQSILADSGFTDLADAKNTRDKVEATEDERNKAIEYIRAYNKKADLKAALDKAEEKFEDFETKRKAAIEKIEKLKAEIAELEAKKAEIETVALGKVASSADGNATNRTTSKNFGERFSYNDQTSTWSIRKKDYTVTKGDVRRAIHEYMNAKPEEQEKWKAAFKFTYENLPEKDKDKTMEDFGRLIGVIV